MGFPQQVVCDRSWVSYNLTLTLFENNVRFHRLRAPAHNTSPTSDADCKPRRSCGLTHYKPEVPKTSLVRFNLSLKCFTEPSHSFLTRFLVYWKVIYIWLRNSQMEEMHRARYVGGDTELPCPLWVTISPVFPPFTTNLETLQTPSASFYGSLIISARLIKSLVESLIITDYLNLQPLFPKGWGKS